MSNADITRLVVGEPFTLKLGKEVGQGEHVVDSPGALVWREGKWQDRPSDVKKIEIRSHAKRLFDVMRGAKSVNVKLRVLAACLVAIAGTGVAIGIVVRHSTVASLIPQVTQPALPLVPMAEPVRTVNRPFEETAHELAVIQTEGTALHAEGSVTLPIGEISRGPSVSSEPALPIGLPLSAPSPLPSPTAKVVEDQPERTKRPASAPNRVETKAQKEDAKPPAVILDELVEKAPKPASPVKQQPEASKKLVTGQSDQKVSTPMPTSSGSGKGLLAITPDGMSAIFTDPATRLPKQFKAGDKLPNGDTIKSIDSKLGKVVAGAKEYNLD